MFGYYEACHNYAQLNEKLFCVIWSHVISDRKAKDRHKYKSNDKEQRKPKQHYTNWVNKNVIL